MFANLLRKKKSISTGLARSLPGSKSISVSAEVHSMWKTFCIDQGSRMGDLAEIALTTFIKYGARVGSTIRYIPTKRG